jgi:hypothetical protein
MVGAVRKDMNYKEYVKLMKTPLDKLSEEDQQKRTEEFNRRMNICKTFLVGMMQGYISEDVENLIPQDDPMREMIAILRIRVNEIEGEA